jgi:hypothetical protein
LWPDCAGINILGAGVERQIVAHTPRNPVDKVSITNVPTQRALNALIGSVHNLPFDAALDA